MPTHLLEKADDTDECMLRSIKTIIFLATCLVILLLHCSQKSPFITVSYLAETCYAHFPCTPNHEVTKARKDEEMCTLQQKKKRP